MQYSTLVKPTWSRCVPFFVLLLVALAATLAITPASFVLAAEARVQRVVFGSAGFTESNRFWNIARPEHLQYDPFLETLLDVDPKTGDSLPAWQKSGRPARSERMDLFAA